MPPPPQQWAASIVLSDTRRADNARLSWQLALRQHLIDTHATIPHNMLWKLYRAQKEDNKLLSFYRTIALPPTSPIHVSSLKKHFSMQQQREEKDSYICSLETHETIDKTNRWYGLYVITKVQDTHATRVRFWHTFIWIRQMRAHPNTVQIDDPNNMENDRCGDHWNHNPYRHGM